MFVALPERSTEHLKVLGRIPLTTSSERFSLLCCQPGAVHVALETLTQ